MLPARIARTPRPTKKPAAPPSLNGYLKRMNRFFPLLPNTARQTGSPTAADRVGTPGKAMGEMIYFISVPSLFGITISINISRDFLWK
jgi:hypothetical protein